MVDRKPLPAYSPNLNLIERLWKFLLKKDLPKWHATFEDMQQAVADVLDNLDRYKEEFDSLITERFPISPRVATIVVGMGCVAWRVAQRSRIASGEERAMGNGYTGVTRVFPVGGLS